MLSSSKSRARRATERKRRDTTPVGNSMEEAQVWLSAVIKRGSDCALAAIGLLLAAPLVPLISLLIVLGDRGPVLYGQERVGKGGQLFRGWKFRSMVMNSDATYGPRQAGENDHRVTRVGHFLRATALDELPQLWNILK